MEDNKKLYSAEQLRQELESLYYKVKRFYVEGKQYAKPTEIKALIYAASQIAALIKSREIEELNENIRKLEEGGGTFTSEKDRKLNEEIRKYTQALKTKTAVDFSGGDK